MLLEVFGFGEKGLAWLAYLVALVASVVWNFTFNRKFTFKSANNVPVAMLKVAGYYLVFTPLSTWWTDYFVETLYVNEYIVLAVTMVINFVTEFCMTNLSFSVEARTPTTWQKSRRNNKSNNARR